MQKWDVVAVVAGVGGLVGTQLPLVQQGDRTVTLGQLGALSPSLYLIFFGILLVAFWSLAGDRPKASYWYLLLGGGGFSLVVAGMYLGRLALESQSAASKAAIPVEGGMFGMGGVLLWLACLTVAFLPGVPQGTSSEIHEPEVPLPEPEVDPAS